MSVATTTMTTMMMVTMMMMMMMKLLVVGCLSSQQHASVYQRRICSNSCMCCHTEIEAADQTCYLIQSQHSGVGSTSPSDVSEMPNRLVGLVVKASASRAEGPGFESRFRQDFFGVESYQWLKYAVGCISSDLVYQVTQSLTAWSMKLAVSLTVWCVR